MVKIPAVTTARITGLVLLIILFGVIFIGGNVALSTITKWFNQNPPLAWAILGIVAIAFLRQITK